jgi:hypothetical protein
LICNEPHGTGFGAQQQADKMQGRFCHNQHQNPRCDVTLARKPRGYYTLDVAGLPNLKRKVEGLNSSILLAPSQKLEGGYTVTYRY